MSDDNEVISRPITKDDESLIFSSWLRSFWDLATSLQNMAKKTFFEYHPALIQKKLRLADTIIMCSKADPNVILGYLVAETASGTPIIHYIYVKEAFRNEKLATDMVQQYVKSAPRVLVTHTTGSNAFVHMFRKYNWDYVPYLF